MIRRGRPLRLGFLTLALWWSSGWIAFATTPTEQIKGTMDRVLDILQNHKDKNEVEKTVMLRQALTPLFDFREMARRSLGNHWEIQAERRDEFVAVFTDYMEISYLLRIQSFLQSFKDEKILYNREQIDKGLAEVDIKIVPRLGEGVSINYKLHLVGNEWKVYDLFIENTSLVSNLRTQFHRIINSSSFDELMKILQEKKAAKNHL